MVKSIADIAKALKESEQTLGVCLQQTLDVLLNHEERLQNLEKPDIRCEFMDIKRFIEEIEDPEKRKAAMAQFTSLYHLLCIDWESFEDAT